MARDGGVKRAESTLPPSVHEACGTYSILASRQYVLVDWTG